MTIQEAIVCMAGCPQCTERNKVIRDALKGLPMRVRNFTRQRAEIDDAYVKGFDAGMKFRRGE